MSPERSSRVTTTAPVFRLLGLLLSLFLSTVTYQSLLTQDRNLCKLILFMSVQILAECLFKSRCPAVCTHVTTWETVNEILLNLTLVSVMKIYNVIWITFIGNIPVVLTISELLIDIILKYSFWSSGLNVNCTRRATFMVWPHAHLERNWISAYISLKCNWWCCYSYYCVAICTSVSSQARSKAQKLLTLCLRVEFFILERRSDYVSRSCGLRRVSRASFGYHYIVRNVSGMTICGRKVKHAEKFLPQCRFIKNFHGDYPKQYCSLLHYKTRGSVCNILIFFSIFYTSIFML